MGVYAPAMGLLVGDQEKKPQNPLHIQNINLELGMVDERKDKELHRKEGFL